MATFAQDYEKALKEFETLTDKRAVTLKNKGKEEGVKKIKMLFKSGKTLDERCADLDAANDACNLMGALSDKKQFGKIKTLVKDVEEAYSKMDQGMKLNGAEFTAQFKTLGSDDKELKVGLEVFVSRLEQLRKRAKIEIEQKLGVAAQYLNKPLSSDEKLVSAIKVVYLTILKGVAEAEALMKVFIARPTEENLGLAFSAQSGPRTLGTAVTNWKRFVLTMDPTMADKLGEDPEQLISHIKDLTQQKGLGFWKTKLQVDQAGWEDRAKAVANAFLAQLDHWRTLAVKVKALNH